MCNLSEGVEAIGFDKGIKEGIKEGILSSIKNLMKTMGWSVQQAMNALKIPADEQDQYAGMIKSI